MQDAKNEDTAALIETVNKTGKAFLITTDLAGRTVARIACGGFLTQVRGFPCSIHTEPAAALQSVSSQTEYRSGTVEQSI